jgi:ribosomal protein S19
MARSKSKLIYIHRSQFKHLVFNAKKRILRTKNNYNQLIDKKISIRPFFLLWKKAGKIISSYFNNKIAVYNGKFFLVNEIKPGLKGYNLGEITNTRRKPRHKGKLRQSKKVIKKTKEEKLSKYTDVNYTKKIHNKKKK